MIIGEIYENFWEFCEIYMGIILNFKKSLKITEKHVIVEWI